MSDRNDILELEAHAPYPARDFSTLKGLRHLPDGLIAAHLKLYEGYVRSLNLLRRSLRSARRGSPEWSEMERRIGFEINGMRLHELYFENLSPAGSLPPRTLEDALAPAWGSFKEWKEEFLALGQMRGVGWVILDQDPAGGRLSNQWIGLHEEGHPAGFVPLLVMDVWEHAYTGMERTVYVDAFFENIHWPTVQARLDAQSSL
ncbi:MAG TPA: Fe-Mn family superoxide dismutase [Planctomycetota bacterium]|nr:Fe-Mn family superoxide dismutase [Planctomycetota bacterium]